ncbi:DUF3846 domain-containing protein [Aldersonia sp. NBC_00410]|uniref:DUF3846 domain-containing protein n=1 Tax=Aldersonia sp. NBC_00410 TaxID=2975954 RepID=UPI0022581D95|nr:DUF3846 domain-containing protein [Aldersonia sp. NBC_00410]MCX5046226.1 DUF3846 domain-containing protein [Aldersonia sp. NBC_00410]
MSALGASQETAPATTALVSGVVVGVNGDARVVELARVDGQGCAAAIRAELGCRWFDVVALTPVLDMWLDDEGLCVSEPVVNEVATRIAHAYGRRSQPYFGPVLFVSHDGEGETVSLTSQQRDALLATAVCRAAVVFDAGMAR